MTTTSGSKTGGRGVLKYELLLLLAAVIWGFAFPAQQIGMEKGLGPMTFNAFRFALGALVLVPFILWRRKNQSDCDKGQGSFPYWGSFASGAFLFAAAAAQQIGLKYTSSANSGFITSFYILFVPLIGLVFGHRTRKSLWVGIAICLVGFYLLSVTSEFRISRGDAWTVACAALFAAQILMVDRVAGRSDSIQFAAFQFAVCAALSAVGGWLFEPCAWSQVQGAAVAIAYTGIFSVGVAYTLQVVCQKRCPPGPAAVIMSLESVFAAIAGYVVLHQTLTGRAVSGCFLILAGVLIVQLVPMLGGKTNEG